MTRARLVRIGISLLAGLMAMVLLAVISLLAVLPSDWFRAKVKSGIIAAVEESTGARAEIGAFHFDWFALTADFAPFILHGTEPAGEPPLFRAESIRVGLKIVSALKHDVDISSLDVTQPNVNVLVSSDGSTNIPGPKIPRRSRKTPIEELIAVAIRELNLRNGVVHYGDRVIPLDVRGQYLNARLLYDFTRNAYQGDLKLEQIGVTGLNRTPVQLSAEGRFVMLRDRVEVPGLHVATREGSLELNGVVEGYGNPRITANVNAAGSLAELGPLLQLPIQHKGVAAFTGRLQYDAAESLRLEGRITGQHLAFRKDRVVLQNVSLASGVQWNKSGVTLRDLTLHALDGIFHGSVEVSELRRFRVSGKVQNVSVESVTRAAGLNRASFSGTVSGPVQISGSLTKNAHDIRAEGRLAIAAKEGAVPLAGLLNINWTERRGTVELGNSWLSLPSSRVDFSGTLGEQLAVHAASTDLQDLLPAEHLVTGSYQGKLPLQLDRNGSAEWTGSLTGSPDSLTVSGTLSIDHFQYQDQKIDRLGLIAKVTSSAAHLTGIALTQETLHLTGSADVGLQNWKALDSGSLSASLAIDGASLKKLLRDSRHRANIDGVLRGTAAISGTVGAPRASLRVDIDRPTIYAEAFDHLSAAVSYAGTGIEVVNGLLSTGNNRVLFSGTYSYPVSDLRNGQLKFDVATAGWSLEEVRRFTEVYTGLTGRIRIKAAGLVSVKNAELFPQTINGVVSVRNLAIDKQPLGDINLDASTTGEKMSFNLAGKFRGSALTGAGVVQLSGDYPSTGHVEFSSIQLSTLQDLLLTSRGKTPFPIEGVLAGGVTFSGPARKPEGMRARVEIPQVQVSPARRTMNTRQRSELALHNEGPVSLEYDGKALQIRSAHLTGRETDLRATGQIAFESRSPVDISVNGNLNLGVLQDFDNDLISTGVAGINASLRGTFANPQFGGRMEIRNASLFLSDIPNGLDNINGAFLFDQRRATIEKLRANTGGGDLQMSGFVGLGAGELIYQLQARADRVRIRYPEGVSASANATLSLTGTSSRSVLSGVVTVLRAGFNASTDIGGLLAASPAAIPGGTQNQFVRNVSLDIRVETVPNLQFQTSLTANLQADADLRIRGTAAKPVVLGRIVVSQGEIQFFGNRYNISRGEIDFFNPVRLEPVLDLSLQTQARGVQVTINFNGPLQHLNVSYRSDPPLQSNEIIALLAVGRAPGTNSSLASSQTVSSSNLLATGSNSVLGQAVANPVSGRLQRFFGVSRLKIDPQLTGLSAVPQARLTVEQQISRDITLTYVTNLSQANQQIIRVEWNLSRAWSVVAVREENGVFGVDFFFRKRLR